MCNNENSDKIIKNQKFLLNLTEKSCSNFQIDQQPAAGLSSSSSASPPSAGSQDIIATTTPPPPSVTPQHHNYHHHHHNQHNQQQSSLSSLSTLGQHPQLTRYIRQSPLIGIGTFRSSIGTTTTTTSSSSASAAAAAAATQAAAAMSSMLGNNVVPPGLLPPLDHYRLQLYNYAMVERLRCSQYPGPLPLCPPGYPAAAAAAAVNGPYGPRFALSMSLFHNRVFQPEEPKPQHSYIGLIAMAILSSPESKLVLSDIYQHILDNYPYFRTRGPGWRNSIRHNLSLNDCFVKAGRSANGKGHYWAIHEANLEDFKKGDFRRRKAQRKVRKHMGLSVDDEGTDSPSPPPLAVTPPPLQQNVVGVVGGTPFCTTSWAAAAAVATAGAQTTGVMANIYSQSRKRQFDVASLLAPDEDNQQQQRNTNLGQHHQLQQQQQQIHSGHYQTGSSYHNQYFKGPLSKRIALNHHTSDIDEDIDVVASDVEDNLDNNQNISNNNNNNDDDDNNQQQLAIINNNDENNSHYDIRQQLQQQQQHNNDDDATTDSPISHQDDDIQQHTNIPSPTGWQGLMQQAWPQNLSPLGAAMDPRILGRYYGQYMAAAAAQQVAASRRATFLNDTATAAAAAAAAANNCVTPTNLTTNSSIIGDNGESHHQHHHHHHHQHQHHHQQQHQQQQHHHQQRIQPKLEKIDLSPSPNEC